MKAEDITDPEERRNYEYQSQMFGFHRRSILHKAETGACKFCGGDGWVPILKRVPHERETQGGVKRWFEWEYRVARCNCEK